MTARIVWTREAADDLDGALAYIAERNPAAAASVAARVSETIASIAKFPDAGRLDEATGCRERVVPGLPS